MSVGDLQRLQKEAEELTPDEQVQLARHLLERAQERPLKPTGDLSAFKGCLKLSVDPIEYQRQIRSEWP